MLTRKLFGLILIFLSVLIPLSPFGPSISRVLVRASPGTITVPDDFPTIQQAINHAGQGDLINVRNGTYYEHVMVNKSVSLVGGSGLATIVDGSGIGVVVSITVHDVLLRGFTIRNSGFESYDAGVFVTSNNVTVAGNGIVDNSWGIYLSASASSCRISGNNITGKEHSHSHQWGGGIILAGSSYHTIVGNTISCGEDNGIYFSGACSYNNILGNTLMNQFRSGIHLSCSNNVIHHNNFMENNLQVLLEAGTNTWNDDYPIGGNYWSDYAGTDSFSGAYQNITGSDGFGDSPHILDENNVDSYPLMQPFHAIRNLDTDLCYVTIQSALNAAETLEGHTIYVSPGTYYEHLIVNAGVSLVGEDPQTTIINGRYSGTVVNITANNVRLSGFTIKASEPTQGRGIHVQSTGNNISDLVVTESYYGIFIENSTDCTISESLLSSNTHAIYASNSSQIIISNNNASSNIGFGIALTSSKSCRITGNNVSHNSHGIHVEDHCENNTFSSNTAQANFYGVYFEDHCENNIVYGNTVQANVYGISIYNSGNNTIFHNNFDNTHQAYSYNSENEWNNSALEGNYWSDYSGIDADGDGIGDTPYPIEEAPSQDDYPLINPLGSIRNINTGLSYVTIQSAINADQTLERHTIRIGPGKYYGHLVVNKSLTLVGEDRATAIIKGINSTEDVIKIAANNVTIENLTVEPGGEPAKSGIYLYFSDFATIRNCLVVNHEEGILLNGSNNNWIEYNNITDNSHGVLLSQSSGNAVAYNSISDNEVDGVQIWGSQADRNLITDNSIFHNGFGNISGSLVGIGISLHLSPSNTISHNTLALNARDGILVLGAPSNSITDNVISTNQRAAISLWGSESGNTTNNLIVRNIIIENGKGLYIDNAELNVIYHNNFLNNTDQLLCVNPLDINIWDNGCEGNYWSNYNGTDLDGDGIGDTYLPWEGVDQDPLMNVYWNPADIDHDLDVDIFDVVRAAIAYRTTPSDPKWNPHCDVAKPYLIINIFDIVMIAGNYGKRYNP